MSRVLTAALLVLTLSAPALPTMAGPDAYSDKLKLDPITCQIRPIPNMAQLQEKVCKRSSEWARIDAGPRFAGEGLGPYAGDGMPSTNLSQPH